MTPVVFSVTPDTPAPEVVRQMLDWNVHHLFVIDNSQVLVGVISTLDVLKHLHR
jgi:CBS-domain-containing membrane protein